MKNKHIEILEEIVEDIKNDKMMQEYLLKYTWISGSSTIVYPIMIWKHDITLQVITDRNVFKSFIERIVNKYSDVILYGCFLKSDGSCPSTIKFYYKEIYNEE